MKYIDLKNVKETKQMKSVRRNPHHKRPYVLVSCATSPWTSMDTKPLISGLFLVHVWWPVQLRAEST